jgi:hypothetical protein
MLNTDNKEVSVKKNDMIVESLSDMELHDQLSHYGYEFVDTSADAQRIEKAPVMVLSTKGANTPLLRLFTFEFRWENPRFVDAPAMMRHAHIPDPESLWVDMNFNLYKNLFEVSPSAVKVTPRGVPVPAYRARTLLNRGLPIVLQKSDESIETLEAFNALEDYRQKQFDIGIIGPLMAERIRRFLAQNDITITAEDLRGRESNPHLRHTLTNEQTNWIVDQINDFLNGARDLVGPTDVVPKGESNEDFPPQVDAENVNVMVSRDDLPRRRDVQV